MDRVGKDTIFWSLGLKVARGNPRVAHVLHSRTMEIFRADWDRGRGEVAFAAQCRLKAAERSVGDA